MMISLEPLLLTLLLPLQLLLGQQRLLPTLLGVTSIENVHQRVGVGWEWGAGNGVVSKVSSIQIERVRITSRA